MPGLPIHSLWIDPYLRAALREYAYNKRTSMSDVVRAVFRDIVRNPNNESVLAPDGATATFRLSVKMEDELWDEAREAARGAGHSLNSLVRRRLRKVMIEEGLL